MGKRKVQKADSDHELALDPEEELEVRGLQNVILAGSRRFLAAKQAAESSSPGLGGRPTRRSLVSWPQHKCQDNMVFPPRPKPVGTPSPTPNPRTPGQAQEEAAGHPKEDLQRTVCGQAGLERGATLTYLEVSNGATEEEGAHT